MFPATQLLTENTGIWRDGTQLLDQTEFTDLCREKHFPVLVDVGHAHANGGDLPRLIRNLGPQIRGFHLHNNDGIHDLHNRLRDGTLDLAALLPCMDREAPTAARIIEYSRPAFHGDPLMEDIAWLTEADKESHNHPSPSHESKYLFSLLFLTASVPSLFPHIEQR